MKITNGLLEEFLNFYKNKNFKKDTIRWYELEMKRFIKHLNDLHIDDTDWITMYVIENYRTALNEQKTTKNSIYFGQNETLSPRTVQTKIQPIKKFLEFLNIIYNTWLNFQYIKCPKVYSRHMDFFEVGEIKTILSKIEKNEKSELSKRRTKLLIVLGFVSWARISELLQLKVKDILNGRAVILWKGNKIREIFFNDLCKDIMVKYLEERKKPLPSNWKIGVNKTNEERAFISHNPNTFWEKVSVQTLCEHNKKINEYLWLKDKKFSAHTMRHSAATYMMDKGVNIREIQEFLGHSDISTTQTYTHLRNNQIQKTHNKIFWKVI